MDDIQLQRRQPGEHIGWKVLACVLLVAGLFVPFIDLTRESLWFDEGYTAWMVSHPVREVIRLIQADTAPPLYYVLLRLWSNVFGHSEFALRSFSAVVGGLCLILIAILARRYLRWSTTCGVLFLTILGAHQNFYVQEARGYILLEFWFLAAILMLLDHLRRPRVSRLIALGLFLAALLYTHNIATFYVFSIVVAWLTLPSATSLKLRLRDISIAAVLTALLFAPWALTALPHQVAMVRASFWVPPVMPSDVAWLMSWIVNVPHPVYLTMFCYMVHSPYFPVDQDVWLGPLLALTCISMGMLYLQKERRWAFVALSVLVLVPELAISLVSQFGRPLLVDKLLLPSASLVPIWVMLCLEDRRTSKGIGLLRPAWFGLMALLAASQMVEYHTNLQREDWRGIARMVENLPAKHRLIVVNAAEGQAPWDYYYHYRKDEKVTGIPMWFFENDPPRTMKRVLTDQDIEPFRARLASWENFDEVVMILGHEGWSDPQGRARRVLLEHYRLVEKQRSRYVTMERFIPRDMASSRAAGSGTGVPLSRRGNP